MKKYLGFFLSLFFLFILNIYAKEFEITGKNVVLYNLNDNSIIFEENKDEKTAIASLTKIMSTIVAIENIEDLNAKVTITYKDFLGLEGYSLAGFKVGDKVTYLDLLYGAMLPSGADAVLALVNNTLKDDFVNKMNEKAKDLGLKNTSFSNTYGKDEEDNYSTANDLAKLLIYALDNKTFKEVFTTKEYKTSNGLTFKSTLLGYGKNYDVSYIDGAKSGFTQKAGRCLASISTLNDVPYLLVVINSSNSVNSTAVKDSLTIYDYYSSNYGYKEVINDDTYIITLPVKLGKTKEYKVTGNDSISLYLKNDLDDISYKYDGVEEVTNKYKKGDKLGKVSIYSKDTLLYEADVYLEDDITFYQPLYLVLIAFVLLILLVLFRKKKKRRRKKR